MRMFHRKEKILYIYIYVFSPERKIADKILGILRIYISHG